MTFIAVSRLMLGKVQTQTFAALSRHPNFRLYWIGALADALGPSTAVLFGGSVVTLFALGMLFWRPTITKLK